MSAGRQTELAFVSPKGHPNFAALARMKTILSISLSLMVLRLGMTAADLSQSTFTQVVNEVAVVDSKTQGATPAQLNGVLQSPDRVRTGPQSRAELRANDGTITRVGANTVFSFDSAGRSLNLEKGSLLFHSPTGKGGGTVKTGRASAAVLGTTLLLVATADGGFKGIVLEGKGKFTLASGASRNLNAGQTVYVLPGNKAFSPTLDINLSKLVSDSGLVKAYSSPLASLNKVNDAISVQDAKLQKGTLTDTGLIAGNTATENTVTVVDSVTFNAALKENQSAVDKAWTRDLKLDEPEIPTGKVFARGEKRYPKGSLWNSAVQSALLGEDIALDTPNLILPPLNGTGPHVPATLGIIADDTLSIGQSVDVHPASAPRGQHTAAPRLVLGGNRIDLKSNTRVSYQADAELVLVSGKSLKLEGSTLETRGGDLKVHSQEGSVDLAAATLRAGPQGTVEVLARKGTLQISGGSLSGRNFTLVGGDKLEIRNTDFRATGGYGALAQTALSAETVILANVALPEGPIQITSREGKLALNPNTGARVVPGYINFIRNVTYKGTPAEQYILNPGVEGITRLGTSIVLGSL